LQKIDGVLRKGIAEAVSEEQPEEIIQKVCSWTESSFKAIFTILYLLSFCKNFHTAGFLSMIEKEL